MNATILDKRKTSNVLNGVQKVQEVRTVQLGRQNRLGRFRHLFEVFWPGKMIVEFILRGTGEVTNTAVVSLGSNVSGIAPGLPGRVNRFDDAGNLVFMPLGEFVIVELGYRGTAEVAVVAEVSLGVHVVL